MIKNNIYEKIIELGFDSKDISLDEPMKKHTSFNVGGPASFFVRCRDKEKLAVILRWISKEKIKHMLIGNGSNLLFTDEGYDGIIIKLNGDFERIEINEAREIVAGSAALLSRVSNFACINALKGMEFASGIPGSIGGAVFMNAGAYGGEMKDIVKEVTLMSEDGQRTRTLSSKDLDFSYRNSSIQKNNEIVLSVILKLEPGEESIIRSRMEELSKKRREKQPVNLPSAGSFFKRPANGYAAKLIEDAGLKGYTVGGASVSLKHSGFVVNNGGATFKDIMALMEHVQTEVNQKFGIMLEPEVRIVK